MTFWRSPNPEQSIDLRLVGRNDFLFTAGALAVIAGLLFPGGAHLLDVVLIFSVCLTAAVLIIAFSANAILEVSGFPLLILAATMLRMGLSVAFVRLILSKADAGTIISLVGSVLIRGGAIAMILIFASLAVVVFVVVWRTSLKLGRAGAEFADDIAPVRQIGIDNDLNAGVIDETSADRLHRNLAREAGFFFAMVGAARFMLCAAFVELLTIAAGTVGVLMMGVAGVASGGVSVKMYAALVAVAGVINQLSALLVSFAARYLALNNLVIPAEYESVSLVWRNERTWIEVVSTEASMAVPESEDNTIIRQRREYVESPGCFEAEFNDTVHPAAPDDEQLHARQTFSGKKIDWSQTPPSAENQIEEADSSLWMRQEVENSGCYDAIAGLIGSAYGDNRKTILMAAESVELLGVNIPVNVAIRLAQSGRRCLLIDLDSHRAAVSKVFDIDGAQHDGGTLPGAIATCIENLWVLPVGYFGAARSVETEVISRLESQYDNLIIYAPDIRGQAAVMKIAACARTAMLFGCRDESRVSIVRDFRQLLNGYGCDILEPDQIFAHAV